MPNANYRENVAVPGGIGGAITLKGLTQNGTDILVPNKLGSPNQAGGAVLADGSISQTGGSSNIMANVKDTPITASSLQPTTPFVTPQASTPTASVGLQAETQSFVNSLKTQAEKQAQTKLEEQKLARDTEANDISSLITGIGGQATKKAEAQQALEPLQEGLDNIISAMEDADLKARRKIEEIQQKNPTGMFGQGGQREIDRINRENASYQADQAIKLSALGRNYDRAKSFIDAKIDAETEGMKAKLEARKFTYENTKDDFTKAEQRKIEADLLKEQRTYDEKKAFESTRKDIVLKAIEKGQTQLISKLLGAKTNDELYAISGSIPSEKTSLTFKTLSDGRDVMLDGQGNIVKEITGKKLSDKEKEAEINKEKAKTQIPFLRDKVSELDNLISTVSSGTGAVGPNKLARFEPTTVFTGSVQNFIAGVSQLISQETLQTLIDLKAQGGTLGALSEKELQALQESASKIGRWAIRDDNNNVIGYNTTESAFKTELEKLRKYTNLAIDKANGTNLSNDAFLNTLPTDTNTSVSTQDFFNNY